jgi:glycosyltransferase involved in cell wall biosynthesis
MPHEPTVHIYMATFNGAKYIYEQLESIKNQTYHNWTLTISDDGSIDDTILIVKNFLQTCNQRIELINGPNKASSTLNFFHLIKNAQIDDHNSIHAFCDQDDVWLEDKLERAVKWHTKNNSHPVRLYCGRTQFVNDKLRFIGLSPAPNKTPSFGNAIVQNIASGNTMVFSSCVMEALQKIHPLHSVWHDWTAYIVATALGGTVWFDSVPCLLYRQHSNNVIGSNNNMTSYIKRVKHLLNGGLKKWTDANIEVLNDLKGTATRESISIVARIIGIRNESC